MREKRGAQGGKRLKEPHKEAHWTIKWVFLQMKLHNDKGMSRSELSKASGISLTTLKRLWDNRMKGFSVPDLEAVFGVFGYGIKPTPLKEVPLKKKKGRPYAK